MVQTDGPKARTVRIEAIYISGQSVEIQFGPFDLQEICTQARVTLVVIIPPPALVLSDEIEHLTRTYFHQIRR